MVTSGPWAATTPAPPATTKRHASPISSRRIRDPPWVIAFITTITVMAAGTPGPVIPSGVTPLRHVGCQAARFRVPRWSGVHHQWTQERAPQAGFSIQAPFETKLGAPTPHARLGATERASNRPHGRARCWLFRTAPRMMRNRSHRRPPDRDKFSTNGAGDIVDGTGPSVTTDLQADAYHLGQRQPVAGRQLPARG